MFSWRSSGIRSLARSVFSSAKVKSSVNHPILPGRDDGLFSDNPDTAVARDAYNAQQPAA